MNNNEYLGKTIFFLFPDKNIEQMIFSFFKEEYEIYPLYSEKDSLKLFEMYGNSLIIINLNDSAWHVERFIAGIMTGRKTKNIAIYAVYEEKIPDVFMNIIINGFIRYDDNLMENLKEIFDKNKVIGRRKYLRLNCEDRAVKFAAKMRDSSAGGSIINISSRAMLCNFKDAALNLKTGFAFDKITIVLDDHKIDLSGYVNKSVEGYNENLYVIMFNIDEGNLESIECIKKIIYNLFQSDMQKKISEIS